MTLTLTLKELTQVIDAIGKANKLALNEICYSASPGFKPAF